MWSKSILAPVLAVGAATPALAHHSFAMFDGQKAVVLDGTVKEFQWTNPHSWLNVVVTDDQGKTAEWALEMGSPSGLGPHGIRYATFKPGDKVKVTLHPLRDGTHGGQFMSVTMADGRVLPTAGPGR